MACPGHLLAHLELHGELRVRLAITPPMDEKVPVPCKRRAGMCGVLLLSASVCTKEGDRDWDQATDTFRCVFEAQ
jgi:hypothetical protein